MKILSQMPAVEVDAYEKEPQQQEILGMMWESLEDVFSFINVKHRERSCQMLAYAHCSNF